MLYPAEAEQADINGIALGDIDMRGIDGAMSKSLPVELSNSLHSTALTSVHAGS